MEGSDGRKSASPRNQAIKERGSAGRKDEWALNESIMINQDASRCSRFLRAASPSLSFLLIIIIIGGGVSVGVTQTHKPSAALDASSSQDCEHTFRLLSCLKGPVCDIYRSLVA